MFPTPPWATRAIIPFLTELDPDFGRSTIWEPAAGKGHMSDVLAETGAKVYASDAYEYGAKADVLIERGDFLLCGGFGDWIITNPPFRLASDFARVGLTHAVLGVALLVRTNWLEGGGRFRALFDPYPPALIAQFSERVPMTKDRWDPNASTATAYCWVVWCKNYIGPTVFRWIPPGQRTALTKPTDVRFVER